MVGSDRRRAARPSGVRGSARPRRRRTRGARPDLVSDLHRVERHARTSWTVHTRSHVGLYERFEVRIFSAEDVATGACLLRSCPTRCRAGGGRPSRLCRGRGQPRRGRGRRAAGMRVLGYAGGRRGGAARGCVTVVFDDMRQSPGAAPGIHAPAGRRQIAARPWVYLPRWRARRRSAPWFETQTGSARLGGWRCSPRAGTH